LRGYPSERCHPSLTTVDYYLPTVLTGIPPSCLKSLSCVLCPLFWVEVVFRLEVLLFIYLCIVFFPFWQESWFLSFICFSFIRIQLNEMFLGNILASHSSSLHCCIWLGFEFMRCVWWAHETSSCFWRLSALGILAMDQ